MTKERPKIADRVGKTRPMTDEELKRYGYKIEDYEDLEQIDTDTELEQIKRELEKLEAEKKESELKLETLRKRLKKRAKKS